jgi:uncharacterized phiE125 gp8 family phage protein
MPFSIVELTQPSHEPLDVDADVKPYLRIDSTDQDTVLARLLKSARISAEQYMRRALVNRTFRLTFDKFPGSWPYSYGFGSSLLSPYREIHIPICPLVSVESFKMVDMTTGELVTLDPATDYQVSLSSEPGRIQPGYGKAWPIARWVLDGGQIEFTAGYGDTQASPVVGVNPPEPILTAILLTIGHFYENRESQEIPKAAENLLMPYRVFDFAPVMNNWERFAR